MIFQYIWFLVHTFLIGTAKGRRQGTSMSLPAFISNSFEVKKMGGNAQHYLQQQLPPAFGTAERWVGGWCFASFWKASKIMRQQRGEEQRENILKRMELVPAPAPICAACHTPWSMLVVVSKPQLPTVHEASSHPLLRTSPSTQTPFPYPYRQAGFQLGVLQRTEKPWRTRICPVFLGAGRRIRNIWFCLSLWKASSYHQLWRGLLYQMWCVCWNIKQWLVTRKRTVPCFM